MITKKLLSVLMTLSLLVSLLCCAALPAAAEDGETSDFDALFAALEAGGEVVLTADVVIPAGTGLHVPEGVTATLDLNGFTISTDGCSDNYYYLLYVEGEATLTDTSAEGAGALRGLIGGVSVFGGSFTLAGGAIECTGSYGEDDPYAVTPIAVAGGTLTITGGTISAPEGIGVYLGDGSAVMSGGAIADCSSGVMVADGSFTLAGGTISDCANDGIDMYGGTATMTGGTISDVGEDGVWIKGGSFTLAGGTISGSGDEGIDIRDGAATMTGGEIIGAGTSGVILNADGSEFRMTGGAVSGSVGHLSTEETWYYNGAGVELFAGSAEIAGGELHDNVYGIAMSGGSAVLSGGVVRASHFICPDEEAGLYYGGAGVTLDAGSFTMTGGALSDNELIGIMIAQGASAAVSGGTISGSDWYGLRLCEGGELTLSGSPVFADNFADLGLDDGCTATIGGPLALEAPISVYPVAVMELDAPWAQLTTGLNGNGSAADFFIGANNHVIELVGGEAVVGYSTEYPDVSPDAWYADAVAYTSFYGIFEGTDKGFEPQLQMTNAMAVQALFRYEMDPTPSDMALPFDDVDADAWYAEALRWAVSEGIVDADKTSFCPSEPITREDLAVLCYRYAGLFGAGFEGLWAFQLDFPDAGDVSDEALEAMSWFVMTGVINGMDGTLNPKGTATRAQTATIFMRLSDVLYALYL